MARLALLLIPAILAAAPDPREIVRRAVEKDEAAFQAAADYIFVERQDVREIDGQGRTRKREIRTYDVTLAGGSPYRRLVARDDQPLSAEEDRAEREKMARSLAERQRETAAQRARRIADWEARRRRQREFMREVPDAFDFRILREEPVDGRQTYVIAAAPRPGYRSTVTAARFLRKMRATLWIDRQDSAWVRIDAEVVETVSIGIFLARFYKGTRVLLEQTRVDGGIWLPRHIRMNAAGRVALVKRIGGEWDFIYRNYRKSEAGSSEAGTGVSARE